MSGETHADRLGDLHEDRAALEDKGWKRRVGRPHHVGSCGCDASVGTRRKPVVLPRDWLCALLGRR